MRLGGVMDEEDDISGIDGEDEISGSDGWGR